MGRSRVGAGAHRLAGWWASVRDWVHARIGLPRRPPPPCRLGTADAVGRRGERAAVRALKRAGYRILARRWKSRGGVEVDVVALDGTTLVVVEVKSTVSAAVSPGARVDHRKRHRLRTAAACLVATARGAAHPIRIDVVEVRFEGRRAHAAIRPGHTSVSRCDGRRAERA